MQKKYNKSVILNIFSAIIKLVRELLISTMHNKFAQDTYADADADTDDAEFLSQGLHEYNCRISKH